MEREPTTVRAILVVPLICDKITCYLASDALSLGCWAMACKENWERVADRISGNAFRWRKHLELSLPSDLIPPIDPGKIREEFIEPGIHICNTTPKKIFSDVLFTSRVRLNALLSFLHLSKQANLRIPLIYIWGFSAAHDYMYTHVYPSYYIGTRNVKVDNDILSSTFRLYALNSQQLRLLSILGASLLFFTTNSLQQLRSWKYRVSIGQVIDSKKVLKKLIELNRDLQRKRFFGGPAAVRPETYYGGYEQASYVSDFAMFRRYVPIKMDTKDNEDLGLQQQEIDREQQTGHKTTIELRMPSDYRGERITSNMIGYMSEPHFLLSNGGYRLSLIRAYLKIHENQIINGVDLPVLSDNFAFPNQYTSTCYHCGHSALIELSSLQKLESRRYLSCSNLNLPTLKPIKPKTLNQVKKYKPYLIDNSTFLDFCPHPRHY